jgi:O-antigen/teichoic acid export membrane protein
VTEPDLPQAFPPETEEFSASPSSLSTEEIRSRAATGAALLTARGILARVLGLVASVLVARYLGPPGSGVIALGVSLNFAFLFFTDGALGVGLIRGSDPPTRADFQALMALQLLVTVPGAIIAAAVGSQFGDRGVAVAVMIAALPILAFRTPSMIVLERELAYRAVATVEIVEAVTTAAATAVMLLAGAGIVGVAAAAPITAVVGVALLSRIGPLGLVRPRWSWPRLRPIIGFGGKVQAIGLASVSRDQLLNFGTVAVAGTRTLGLWGEAYSILQAPTVVFEPLWRVAYPAVARLIDRGEDPRPYIERGIRLIGVVTGLLMVGVVATGRPGIALIFGDRFAPASAALPWAAIGLLVSMPVSVCLPGYLFATGRVGVALQSTVVASVVWVLVSLTLLPVIGVQALGVGCGVDSLVAAAIISRSALGGTVMIARLNGVMIIAASVAGTAGWWAAGSAHASLSRALIAGATGTAVYLVLMSLLARGDLRSTWSLIRRVRTRPAA